MDESSTSPESSAEPQYNSWDVAGLEADFERGLAPRQPAPDAPQDQPATPATDPQPGAAPESQPETAPPAETPGEPAQQPAEAGSGTEAPQAQEDLAAIRESAAAVDQLGGLEELQMATPMIAPLMAPEVDFDGFFQAFETNRGTPAFNSMAWEFGDRYGDSYLRSWITNPDSLLANNPELLEDPQRRFEVEQLRTDLREFGEWRANGRPTGRAAAPQPVTQPAPTNGHAAAPVGAITLPTLSDDVLDDSPQEVRAFYDAVRAIAPQVEQLRSEVGDVRRLQESERQRIQRERAEAQNRESQRAGEVQNQRLAEFHQELDRTNETLLSKIKFSTSPNSETANNEDAEMRRDLDARITQDFIREVQQDRLKPEDQRTLSRAYDSAARSYVVGDKIGARQSVKALKAAIQTIAQRHISRYSGRMMSTVKQVTTAPVTTQPPNGRVEVTGSGSGSMPGMAPASPDTSKSWDPEAMGREYDQMMSQRRAART